MDSKSSPHARLRSGELARLAGVSTDTLRHYERLGLLACPERAANDYRQYPFSALERVRLIQGALTVGFTLAELASLLRTRDQGGIPCRQVRALAADKLKEVEERLSQMQQMRDHLCHLLHEWDTRLDETQQGERARLLERLLNEQIKNEVPPRPTLLGQTRRRKR
ncbi:MAG TPA: heavy metal-responsive transcriptional regulator [Chthonomonadaceae bacterium]|nr:heavy metal-responsive transcriptional regulator [Chthonomonadaceae bacterium]